MADQNFPPEESAEDMTPTFTEAPAVVFTQLYRIAKDGQTYQINLTVRAVSPEAAIDTLTRGIAYALNKYQYQPTRPDTMAAAVATAHGNGNGSTPAQQPQAPAQPGTVPPPAPQSVNPPGATGGAGVAQKPILTITAAWMEVTPLPENKVTLKWYGDGDQYPRISATKWSVDKTLQFLAPTGAWNADHLRLANKFKVSHVVSYRESDKMSTSGHPYKDITGIANA